MQLTDADKVYEAFFTGCALAGPEGCSIASEGQTPLDVNNNIQQLLQAAHDATRANSSVPITSGQIRSRSNRSMCAGPSNAEAEGTLDSALTSPNHVQSYNVAAIRQHYVATTRARSAR